MTDSTSRRYRRQVHEVVVREHDANEDRPRFLHLVPLGDVLGVAITRSATAGEERPPVVEDEDFIFVDFVTFTSTLGALGLTAAPGVAVSEPKP